MTESSIKTVLICVVFTALTSLDCLSDTITHSVVFKTNGMSTDSVYDNLSKDYCSKIYIEPASDYVDMTDHGLPIAHLTFRVPLNSTDHTVRISGSQEYRTINLAHPIYPDRDISTKYTEPGPEIIEDRSFFTNDDLPPVRITNNFILNNDRFITIATTPVLYNGDNSLCARIFRQLDIEINYSCTLQDNTSFVLRSTGKFNRPGSVMSNGSRNYGIVAKAELNTEPSENYYNSYVILTPENLKDYTVGLHDWKKQKGFNVITETFENIYNSNDYKVGSSSAVFDNASSVREWLRDFFIANGPFHCIIIGDYLTSAPIRKFNSLDKTDPDHICDEMFDPTDIYFADLATEWSFTYSKHGIYTTPTDKTSFSPTISVGRLLCSSGNEIENFTRKLILYESFPGLGDSEYLNKATLVIHRDDKRHNPDANTLFNGLNAFAVDSFVDNEAQQLVDIRPFGEDVLNSMSNSGLYSIQVHGAPCMFEIASVRYTSRVRSLLARDEYRSVGGIYNNERNNALDMLGNKNHPSILYTLSCEVCPFDTIHKYINKKYNLASSFTVAGDYGGPAFLGNTRSGYFSKSSELEAAFSKYIKNHHSIGYAENMAKLEYAGHADYRFKRIIARHSIIGDPELKIWTSAPQFLTSRAYMNKDMIRFRNMPELSSGTIALSSGKSYSRTHFNSISEPIVIDRSFGNENNYFTIYAECHSDETEYYPAAILVTNGRPIENQNFSVHMQNATFLHQDSLSSFDADIYNVPAHLNVGAGSEISIISYQSVHSDNGIVINSHGNLNLDAENSVTLKNDVVRNGGSLSIQGKTVSLGEGFSIEKGGSLTITTK